MNVIGVIPARMGSSRFPGKPLALIRGMPMVEHVYRRAAMYNNWTHLCLATCDAEIVNHAMKANIPVVDTAASHTRALDRVAEAARKVCERIHDQDVVVCIQGDEPMMRPDMIDAVVDPIANSSQIRSTVLGMAIEDKELYESRDTVKIVNNVNGRVLYNSRAPIPFADEFSKDLGAKRIYGIFAFRWEYLEWFTMQPESPLEVQESCDTNRLCDYDGGQYVADYPCIPSFSVDSPADREKVEAHMADDPLWGRY